MLTRSAFSQLAEAILNGGAKNAKKYLSPSQVIKATRRGKRDKRSRTIEILFTAGSPNYEEREFIKKAKKAGEPFPIRRILLKFDQRKGA